MSLQGEAQREIVRVSFDCCLQEAAWNPYYAALLKNVLAAAQGHCVTAQFCIWDHLKDIGRQDDRRVKNLALLCAQLVTTKALPLASLRVGLYPCDAMHQIIIRHLLGAIDRLQPTAITKSNCLLHWKGNKANPCLNTHWHVVSLVCLGKGDRRLLHPLQGLLMESERSL